MEKSSREYFGAPTGSANAQGPQRTPIIRRQFDSGIESSNDTQEYSMWQRDPTVGQVPYYDDMTAHHQGAHDVDHRYSAGTNTVDGENTNYVNHFQTPDQNTITNNSQIGIRIPGAVPDQHHNNRDAIYDVHYQFSNSQYDEYEEQDTKLQQQQKHYPTPYLGIDFERNPHQFPLQYDENYKSINANRFAKLVAAAQKLPAAVHSNVQQRMPHQDLQHLHQPQPPPLPSQLQTIPVSLQHSQQQEQQQQIPIAGQNRIKQEDSGDYNQVKQGNSSFNELYASDPDHIQSTQGVPRYDDLFGLGVGEVFSDHPESEMPPPPSKLQKLLFVRDFSGLTLNVPPPNKHNRRRKKPTHMHLSFDDLLSQPMMNSLSMPQTADGIPGGVNLGLDFGNDFYALNGNVTPFMVPPLVENDNGYFPNLQSPSFYGTQQQPGEMTSYFNVPLQSSLLDLQEQEVTGAVLREKNRKVLTKQTSYNLLIQQANQAQYRSGLNNDQVPLKRKYTDSPEGYKAAISSEPQLPRMSTIKPELPQSSRHRRVQSSVMLAEKHNERIHQDSDINLSKKPIVDDSSSGKVGDQRVFMSNENLTDSDLQSVRSTDASDSAGQKIEAGTVAAGGKKRSSKGSMCTVCKKFIKRDFTRHMRIHDRVGRFQCVYPKSMCLHKTQNFNRPYDYKKHLLHIHFVFENHWGKITKLLTDKLPLTGSCLACGEMFIASDWLENHVLTTDSSRRCKHVIAPTKDNMASLMAESEEPEDFEYDEEENFPH
ncbi:uncharacterized protein KQ657_005059 [Scheffersomyces spartinae]|uniref:Uncharacterized protein n=1 Tax=Scheffersomyces spartinae TaxID=45513 RepID=A0A9P8AIL6_9ASCO|nr:uncharacterized protein KQ657_005059 [Scheffersomyces spartinae]KAG7193861.1 hypothetical protein KQ657_005059 [Scheffersomyces spartinae]